MITVETRPLALNDDHREVWTAFYETYRLLLRWERDGNIRGGSAVGSTRLRFFADVETVRDIERLVLALPITPYAVVTTEICTSWEDRLDDIELATDDDISVS